MMGDKVLVKADPSMFIEPGTAPSTRELFNAARGISRDGGSLGAKGRLAGVAGLAGKAAAAYATADGVAEGMQGGNPYAGLGAQYNMQGLDPTQPLSRYIESGRVQSPAPAPAPAPVNHQASMQPHLDAIMGTQPAPTPTPVAVSSPPIMSHEEAIAQRRKINARPPSSPYTNPLQPVSIPNQTPPVQGQPVQGQPVQDLTQYGMGFEGQPPQVQGQQPQQVQGQTSVNDAHITGMEEYMRNQKNAGEFTDMLYDILGPDSLYKMSPHEVGELAAFMYIKTR